jgi:hypothetical protein
MYSCLIPRKIDTLNKPHMLKLPYKNKHGYQFKKLPHPLHTLSLLKHKTYHTSSPHAP